MSIYLSIRPSIYGLDLWPIQLSVHPSFWPVYLSIIAKHVSNKRLILTYKPGSGIRQKEGRKRNRMTVTFSAWLRKSMESAHIRGHTNSTHMHYGSIPVPRDGLLYHFIQHDKERFRPGDVGRQDRRYSTPQTANETDAEHQVLVQRK